MSGYRKNIVMNEIRCGDAYTELMKIDSDSVDLIITSPPYFGQRKYIPNVDEEIGTEKYISDYLHNLFVIFSNCARVCKPTGNIIFNIGDKYIDGDLQLIPYRFALTVKEFMEEMKLINDITWVKSNPTPRQYKRRLVSSTEPFFHFVKSDDYYYNRDAFLVRENTLPKKISPKKGAGYLELIATSDLTDIEKYRARAGIAEALSELHRGEITDFRMKIRGIHKKAFGGQSGGRNSQIELQGYTIIKMHGNKIKRDAIETSVANTKNIDHPAVFPLKVIRELILLLSAENNIILDPFCGSGQVCLAAKSLNRQYLGIDLNPEYCKATRERLINFPDK